MNRRTLLGLILIGLSASIFFWLNSTAELSQKASDLSASSPNVPAKRPSPSDPRGSDAQPPESFLDRETASSQRAAQPTRVMRAPPRAKKTLRPDTTHLQASTLLATSSWQLWRGVRATLQPGDTETVLGKAAGYSLVEGEVTHDERSFSTEEPLVYYDSRRGVAGLVRGVFQVELAEGAPFEDLLQSYNLKVEGAFPHLKIYFLSSRQNPVDLVALKERLESERFFVKTELEILSRSYEKN